MKIRRFFLLCAVVACLSLSAPCNDSYADKAGPKLPAQLPVPKKTQAIVRNITIEIRDIFEGDNLGTIYDVANNLKVNTKEHVVRRELLIKEGEPYDQFLADESARILRRFSFLGNVVITPTYDGNFVDVLVSVRDNWTLVPQLSFSSGGGGSDKKAIGLAEGNLLGYGKRAEVLVADDEGRSKYEGVYDDPRLFGTFQRLLLGRFERSDGYRMVGLYGRPFRALTDRDSWTTFSDKSNLVGRLFELGDERFIFRQHHEEVGGRYTLSSGNPEELLRRFAVGYNYQRDKFIQASQSDFDDINLDPNSVSNDPRQLADDRKFSGPFFVFESISPDYITTNYIDRFEWTEDYNLGTEFTMRNDFAGEAFGSSADTYLLNTSVRRGFRFAEKEFIRTEFGASSRFDNGGADNALIRGEWKYYNILGEKRFLGLWIGKHTLAGSMSLDYGYDLDRDRELLAGAETGLRGYEDRTFTGDKRLIINMEDRFHLVENIFQFVSLGGAVFADVGGSTYEPLGQLVRNEMYTNVGIGLRIGFPKSSGGGVVRVDLAFPLRADPEEGDKSPILLFGTGQMFSARTRAELVGIERANVTVGQDR